jgi:hypothetical protein
VGIQGLLSDNQNLWKAIQQNNLQEQCALISEDSQLRPTQQQRMWEQLDKKLLKLRLEAEKRCRKLKMGKVHWSPEFAQQKLTLKYWCLAFRICQGKSIDKKFFRRIAKAADLPATVSLEAATVQEHITTQRESIKLYKKKHIRKRETFLEGLAKALAEEVHNGNDKDLKRMNYIKLLHQREQQRQSARTIRYTVAPDNMYQQLDHIVFDNDEGNQVTTYDKIMMERQLIAENQRRFNQAADSPFFCEELVKS